MSKLEMLTQEVEEKVCSYNPQPERLTRARKKNLEAQKFINSMPKSKKGQTVNENIETVSHNNDLNQEIKKITSLVRGMKVQQTNFTNKVNFIEESLHGAKCKTKSLDVNSTDEQKVYHMLKFLTVVLVSMMFDEDKKNIGYEKLLKLFRAYRFGLRDVQQELTKQGCRPTLQVISCIEKLMENPVEENLREFLFVYKHCSDKGRIHNAKRFLKYGHYIVKKYTSVVVVVLVVLSILYLYFVKF